LNFEHITNMGILKIKIFNDPEILDKERYYYKRLISEVINIKSQRNALNMQSDIELLQQSYIEILNKI